MDRLMDIVIVIKKPADDFELLLVDQVDMRFCVHQLRHLRFNHRNYFKVALIIASISVRGMR